MNYEQTTIFDFIEEKEDDNFIIINDDMNNLLKHIKPNSIDSVITDPPYELNFMNKGWDNAGVSFSVETWKKCYEVLKPGGYLLAFGGSRTFHRIACAIEDAGFEIRDCIMWLYGSGFPKSMNIGLAIDKKNGVESKVVGETKTHDFSKHKGSMMSFANTEEQETSITNIKIKQATNEWNGWGTCLKPAFEPIIVARKPFKGSLVDNVLQYGVGGLNIDECRVGNEHFKIKNGDYDNNENQSCFGNIKRTPKEYNGRFPANIILSYDETDFEEVCGGFPDTKGFYRPNCKEKTYNQSTNIQFGGGNVSAQYNDSGSASRYFYCAKASKKDRDEGLEERGLQQTTDGCIRNNEETARKFGANSALRKNIHPTVKPTTLMQYLVRLVTPKGGTILDPFMGSGSTGKAVMYENNEREANYKFVGIELSEEYCNIAKARINFSIKNKK